MNIFNLGTKTKSDVPVSESTTKKCKFCKEEILKDANVCKHCGKTIPREYGNKALLIGLLIIFLPVIISSFSPSSSSETATATPQMEHLNVGDLGYLQSNSGTAMLATTQNNEDKLTKLSVAKDTEGITQMVLDGDVILIDSGTKVRVIGQMMFSREVRVLEGKNYGKSGWVPNEFLSKNK